MSQWTWKNGCRPPLHAGKVGRPSRSIAATTPTSTPQRHHCESLRRIAATCRGSGGQGELEGERGVRSGNPAFILPAFPVSPQLSPRSFPSTQENYAPLRCRESPDTQLERGEATTSGDPHLFLHNFVSAPCSTSLSPLVLVMEVLASCRKIGQIKSQGVRALCSLPVVLNSQPSYFPLLQLPRSGDRHLLQRCSKGNSRGTQDRVSHGSPSGTHSYLSFQLRASEEFL